MKQLHEIPAPHIRFFPDHADRKRRIYVTISFFPGTGSHFHCEIREEHNYVLDREGDEWIVPEHDPAGEGLHRFMKFNREQTARRWVEEVCAEAFPGDAHELVFRGDVSNRWFYPEGD